MITLIVILAYILYKRLLNFLKKDQLGAKYFSIESFKLLDTHPAVQAEIIIKMTQSDVIFIKILNSQPEFIGADISKQLTEGVHHLKIDLGTNSEALFKTQIQITSSTQSWVKSL